MKRAVEQMTRWKMQVLLGFIMVFMKDVICIIISSYDVGLLGCITVRPIVFLH
jgi:hypothetical protein